MNRVDLTTRCLMGVPNTDKPIAMTGRMFHRLVRDLQSTVVQNVNGSPATRTPFGATVFTRRGSGGVSGQLPFQVVTDGATDDEVPKPKIKVIAGNILARAPAGDGEADQTQIPESYHTFDGSLQTAFQVWLDLKEGEIGFGSHSSLTAEEIATGRTYFILLAEVNLSAESGSTPSSVTSINTWWRGDVVLVPENTLPEHDHSDSTTGGNQLLLTKDGDQHPSLQVGNEEYVFQIGDDSFLSSSWQDG